MSASIANISLYIPHIFANFTKEDVSRVFENLNIGKVKNIDFVSKMNQKGKVYNAAYIHFDEWYNTVVARNFQARVLDINKEARIMYEDPWYWLVLENKAQKHMSGDRKPTIIVDIKPEEAQQFITPVKDTTFANSIGPWTIMAPVKGKNTSTSVLRPISLDKLFDSFPTLPVKKESVVVATEEMYVDEKEMAWLDACMEEEENQIDEIETAINEEDQYIVSVDSRYIQALEEENRNCRQLCEQYYTDYCRILESYKSEAIKSHALAEAIQMIKK